LPCFCSSVFTVATLNSATKRKAVYEAKAPNVYASFDAAEEGTEAAAEDGSDIDNDFECEYECGFEGDEATVTTHELGCAANPAKAAVRMKVTIV
jgi:hypothetical protein